MSTQVGVIVALFTHACPDAHAGLHALAARVVVHSFVVLTQAAVDAQYDARQGVVLTVTASWKVQVPADGVAPALVARRTFEMSAPFVPPGAIDW
jgi:hypothetical protein